jgi:hypothetical protein
MELLLTVNLQLVDTEVMIHKWVLVYSMTFRRRRRLLLHHALHRSMRNCLFQKLGRAAVVFTSVQASL